MTLVRLPLQSVTEPRRMHAYEWHGYELLGFAIMRSPGDLEDMG